MPLTLVKEDGTGLVGANSYADLTDFADYAAAHLYAAAWTAATDPVRAVALVMATRTINALVRFRGAPLSTTQALDWPRWNTVLPYPVPARLKDATCELALELLSGNRLADPAEKGIAEIGLGQGAIAIKFNPDDRKDPLPAMVVAMLEPLCYPIGGKRGMIPIRRGI